MEIMVDTSVIIAVIANSKEKAALAADEIVAFVREGRRKTR